MTRTAFFCVALLALATSAAAASPSKEFEEATSVFRAGDYEKSAVLFGSLLYPDPELSDAQEIIDAHFMLAVSYYELKKLPKAEREFEEAVALNPELRISTYGVSRDATDFFEQKKKDLEDRQREATEKERRARELEQQREAVNRIRIKERRNFLLNLVPFGVGQFQNGERNKSIFFASSEFGLATTSVATWAYLRSRYPDGKVPLDELTTARNLQILQITSGALFLGVAVWGVVDAIFNYENQPRPLTAEEKREYLKAFEKEEPEKSSLRIVPTLTPDGAGAALSWEF